MFGVFAQEKGSQALAVVQGWRPATVKPQPLFQALEQETVQVGSGSQRVWELPDACSELKG